jgi:hypothetical protein
LDFLGFPWILSSESRLINELREIFRARNFLDPFPRRSQRREREPAIEPTRMRRIAHEASLIKFLIFVKQLLFDDKNAIQTI